MYQFLTGNHVVFPPETVQRHRKESYNLSGAIVRAAKRIYANYGYSRPAIMGRTKHTLPSEAVEGSRVSREPKHSQTTNRANWVELRSLTRSMFRTDGIDGRGSPRKDV